MLAEEINRLFDQALTMRPGQTIRIACTSRSEQDSTRAQLYRVRKTYLSKALSPVNISIARFTDKKSDPADNQPKHYVLVKRETAQVVELVNEDGTTTPLVFPSTSKREMTSDDERLVAIMRSDGLSEEEIEEYFAEGGES